MVSDLRAHYGEKIWEPCTMWLSYRLHDDRSLFLSSGSPRNSSSPRTCEHPQKLKWSRMCGLFPLYLDVISLLHGVYYLGHRSNWKQQSHSILPSQSQSFIVTACWTFHLPSLQRNDDRGMVLPINCNLIAMEGKS
jgi:hypothetical protein